ncbi:MAG: hypothetical protein GTO41_01515 [Burkholderiales bacterium]|nr:hypothetical protein [Burkholderiales bacterium]
MPCAGCQRRRTKMIAAYNAVKVGLTSAKISYKAATAHYRLPKGKPQKPQVLMPDASKVKIIDIRQ